MEACVLKIYKLSVAKLQQLLNDHSYSCAAKLQDLHLGDEFKDVEIRDRACGDTIEKLYYSAGFEPVCVYCGCDQPFTSPEQYPQYECSHHPPVKKKISCVCVGFCLCLFITCRLWFVFNNVARPHALYVLLKWETRNLIGEYTALAATYQFQAVRF